MTPFEEIESALEQTILGFKAREELKNGLGKEGSLDWLEKECLKSQEKALATLREYKEKVGLEALRNGLNVPADITYYGDDEVVETNDYVLQAAQAHLEFFGGKE